MNINDLSREQLQQLLALAEQVNQQQTPTEESDQLPTAIMEPLEELTIEKARSAIKSFAKNVFKFEGGDWTLSGAINSIAENAVKKYKCQAKDVIQGHHRDGDRFRAGGHAASELFIELEQYRNNHAREDPVLEEIQDKLRSLSIYLYATGRVCDDEAKMVAEKAMFLKTDRNNGGKRLAFSPEEVAKIETAQRERALRNAPAPGHQSQRQGLFFGKKKEFQYSGFHRHQHKPNHNYH